MIELIDLEQKLQGQARRSKVYDGIDSILSKNWTSREEALAETEWKTQTEKKDVIKVS